MRRILTTASFITIGLIAVTVPAMAGVKCGWECAGLTCEYGADPSTGCEDTIWGFCLDAWCSAQNASHDNDEAKVEALKKVGLMLKQDKPDFEEIVATLQDFYGPSFRISTKEGMIFDAATLTGVGLDLTPEERVAECLSSRSEDTAAAD